MLIELKVQVKLHFETFSFVHQKVNFIYHKHI